MVIQAIHNALHGVVSVDPEGARIVGVSSLIQAIDLLNWIQEQRVAISSDEPLPAHLPPAPEPNEVIVIQH